MLVVEWKRLSGTYTVEPDRTLRTTGRPEAILDHLLALAGNDEDDLLGAGVVVSRMALAGTEVDDAAREAAGAVDVRGDGQRQASPVEGESVDLRGSTKFLSAVMAWFSFRCAAT